MEKKVNVHAISDTVCNAMMPHWFLNAVRNYEHVKNALNEERAFCMSKKLGAYAGKPGMVIGSGPSLIPCLPYIKKWQDESGGIIFCGMSNINILIQAGIKPGYMCIYDFRDKHTDPNFGISTAPEGYYDNIPMITAPEYDYDFIRYWMEVRKNPIYFHMRGSGGEDNKTYVYYLMNLLPMAYVFSPDLKHPITSGIFNVGCVANQELIACAYMGCDPIYMCGVNFGYPLNKNHVKPMIFKNNEWVEHEYQKDFTEKHEIQFESDNGVLTDPICVFYKQATLIIWSKSTPQIYEASVDNLWGILDLIPKIDLKELTNGGAVHVQMTIPERTAAIDEYRAKHDYKPINWSADLEIPKEEDGLKHGDYNFA